MYGRFQMTDLVGNDPNDKQHNRVGSGVDGRTGLVGQDEGLGSECHAAGTHGELQRTANNLQRIEDSRLGHVGNPVTNRIISVPRR